MRLIGPIGRHEGPAPNPHVLPKFLRRVLIQVGRASFLQSELTHGAAFPGTADRHLRLQVYGAPNARGFTVKHPT